MCVLLYKSAVWRRPPCLTSDCSLQPCLKYFTLSPVSSALSLQLRNLQAFNCLILRSVPLFQAETILSAPEIILHPNANEIDKMCVHCIRGCVEVTKVTRRSPG